MYDNNQGQYPPPQYAPAQGQNPYQGGGNYGYNNNNNYDYNNSYNNNNTYKNDNYTYASAPNQGAGGPTGTFDEQHFIRRPGEFTFDLSTCCSRGCKFCCEGYCCFYCQLARQCSMNDNGESSDGNCTLACAGMAIGDWCLVGFTCCPFCGGGCVSWVVNCMTRGKTRARFNIKGDCCSDCCASVCCAWCVVQQTFGEYYVQGYNPPTSFGGTDSYPTPQINAHTME